MSAYRPSSTDYVQALTPQAKDKISKESTFVVAEDTKAAEDAPSLRLVPFTQLFAYADKLDYLLMGVGTVSALAAGTSQPVQMLLFGDVVNAMNPVGTTEATVSDQLSHDVNIVARNFALVGVGVLICGFLQVACWSLTASRQAKRIRSAYVSAILNKEMGWFDVTDSKQFSTRVAESTVTIQEGIGRKLGDGLHYFSLSVTGLVISFVKGWKLTLILLAFIPFIAVAGGMTMNFVARLTQESIEANGKAGAIAQESLSNIRTVHIFNAIDHFKAKYQSILGLSAKAGIKKETMMGLGLGVSYFGIYCLYACGLFFGAVFIANDREDECTGDNCYSGGRVLTVLFSSIMGSMAMSQAGPSMQALASARTAAYDVFEVINRPSKIDPLSEEGVKLDKVNGSIQIENVSFAYPSRPDVRVCSNYSLRIEAGETVALVGPSGSGKSTMISLLERFYDPLSGHVKMDGVDVRELNVQWLRQQVGLVGQEPILFATSIMENIRHGCPGASDADVINAAKMANAYSFIKDFPEGFKTEVGERGTQLSGGQKQRIAIARAIIKNPAILLLDEATSALDTESERIVQESLDKLVAASRRTTVIVAHRLSTIRNADKIAVHSGGAIVELGTHDELMQIANGHYRALVDAQSRVAASEQIDIPSVDLQRDSSLSSRSRSLSGPVLERSLSKLSGVYDDEEKTENSDVEDESLPSVSVGRIWQMSLPELKFMVSGSLGAMVTAAMFPLWGYALTKATVLYFDDITRHEMLTNMRYWSLGLIGFGIVFIFSATLQNYSFAHVSQSLISRVRLNTFSAMLRNDVGWFDRRENSSGVLVTRLATDTTVLQAFTSDTLNFGLFNLSLWGVGLGVSFYYTWQVTLLLIALSPALILGFYVENRVAQGTMSSKKNNDADTAAASLLSEAITAVRTVASFNMEKYLNTTYTSLLDVSKSADTKIGLGGGFAFGVSKGLVFFTVALELYAAGKWMASGDVTFESVWMVLSIFMFNSNAVGLSSQNMTDRGKAKVAAARIFKILDDAPAIDAASLSGAKLAGVHGDIEFRNVVFAYPSRPDAQIYKNYNLKIRAGQTVALVGASGSGKSTAISLLERFYDPAAGHVTLDGTDLRQLQLPWLRERISLVSQEPVLFAGTIAENIAMGKPGATRDEVVEAAKRSNAYDFISNFPNGFDTDVGDRGAQISGGQKQRIAIARAILRDPEVLLLDEATSALDNESERIVQESLDRLLAQKKRTTIIVAHRLSTIRNADLVAVTKDGEIVEQGTHDELMSIRGGIYQGLVAAQMRAH
ncbi:hypothetical protein Poli38472_012955 [Pythium oligandrum]|uniref:Uncharacterized protein n=1 Tax=Pythium oligandrum TaxID=41045 RepID=A0A8K1FN61_PYTOL|nr:hypothetical protein Poli38472_012955 [Pythium oligandrum]|eukprot:TMW64333.1 hypothetical protein Poli38472_012955 [Pythium oligandrum]